MLRHRLTTFLLLLAGEASSLILLHRRAPQPLDQLLSSPPEDAVIAVVHYIALGVHWWLAISTLLYLLATASRVPTLIRSIRWITTPGVRAVVDGVVATTIIASSTLSAPSAVFAAPAGLPAGGPPADPAPAPPYRPHPAGDPGSTPPPLYKPRPAADEPASPHALPYQPYPAGDPAEPALTPGETKSSPPPGAAPGSSHAVTYVIQSGDHLWAVAARLGAEKGSIPGEVTTRDVGGYWIRLVDLNRTRLRSGDPNVVYKGETILLPSWEDG